VDVFLHYQPQEIVCRTHGRLQEAIPWARPQVRVTHRVDFLLLRSCRHMTQQAAAQLLRIPPSTLSELLHSAIAFYRDGHAIRGLRTIGIDEISYRKGRRFATVVYDLDRSCVVWISDGKGRDTIDRFFKDVLSDHQRKHILHAACDMSAAYMGAIQDHCPNATLVLDRFHIVQALNKAVDEVRKEQWRLASKEDRAFYRGLRWLLFQHSSTRTKADTRKLNTLQHTGNRRIFRGWILKDEFEQFWDYTYPGAARNFLRRWITRALRSRLEPLRTFANTIRTHADHLLAFISTRLTNAASEGINRILRMVKNRASGFRSLDAFSDLIYLTIGDLNLPEQVPAPYRLR
jgi:transposase